MEKLSKKEFTFLLETIQTRVLGFEKTFSEIRIEDGNFDYTVGKTWELHHGISKEAFNQAKQILDLVKKNPNNITYSLGLYLLMENMVEEGRDFSKIESFKKKLIIITFDLDEWKRAFSRVHLIPLAIVKDKNENLYR